jgi:hypothetical protein
VVVIAAVYRPARFLSPILGRSFGSELVNQFGKTIGQVVFVDAGSNESSVMIRSTFNKSVTEFGMMTQNCTKCQTTQSEFVLCGVIPAHRKTVARQKTR